MPRNCNVHVCICTADPHYFCTLWSHSLKFICNRKIKPCSAFMVIHGHSQRSENFKSSDTCVPSLGQPKQRPAFFFKLFYWKCVLFVLYLVTLFYVLCFLWVALLLKVAPKHSVKCCLVFLSARSLCCALWRKWVLDKLRSSMNYSAVGG